MNQATSLQRVQTALDHEAPQRVPQLFIFASRAAREVGMTPREYFSDPERVIETQLRILEKYSNDCVSAFSYAAVDAAAWGGDVRWFDDGPPNAGAPVIRDPAQIDDLEAPTVAGNAALMPTLAVLEGLAELVGDTVPIVGVVIAPLSLPVMQLGFEGWLDLLRDDPVRVDRLLALNSSFCTEWANAQLVAGATAICYFNPVASPTILPVARYRELGLPVDQRTIAQIDGATVTHMASGRSLGIVDELVASGTKGIGFGFLEDVAGVRAACQGRLMMLGNLNGVAMRHWTPAQAADEVHHLLDVVGPGGGFCLSDSHGEVPWQVPDEVLRAIALSLERHAGEGAR